MPAPLLTVPEVLGKTLSQAEETAAATGFAVSAQGDDTGGPIRVQLPAPGAEVEKGWTRILVWFEGAE